MPRLILRRIVFLLLILSFPAWFQSCAFFQPATAPEATKNQIRNAPAASGWWYARFRIHWPAGAAPAWHLDPFLAHQVIAPVLHRYEEDISLWRFHRRANRDNAGHQFSFIFFASADIASEIFDRVREDPLIADLKQKGLLEAVVMDATDAVKRPAIESTSDSNWSLQVRKAWPHYIMGVSVMWLDLTERIAAGIPPDPSLEPINGALDRYARVNAEITRLWRDEGGHAFFHHLSAVFGYEPLYVVEKRLIRF